MQTLVTAPGVLRAAMTTYVTAQDVTQLIGCKKNKAYQIIREINAAAVDSGKMAYSQGKANKYYFAEQFGIPMEVINAVIDLNKG